MDQTDVLIAKLCSLRSPLRRSGCMPIHKHDVWKTRFKPRFTKHRQIAPALLREGEVFEEGAYQLKLRPASGCPTGHSKKRTVRTINNGNSHCTSTHGIRLERIRFGYDRKVPFPEGTEPVQ